MREIPEELRGRPFSRAQAQAVGVTSRMLEGARFVRVHGGVWRLREHRMTPDDRVTAAHLALPARAHLTGITRLQQLGLDFGPRSPLRFVMQGDLHRELDGVFLHRTKKLAPTDDVGVVVSAAYLSYCSLARVIDAIKVGDWLLHHEHTTRDEISALALAAPWRDGAAESLWVLDHLDAASRSLKESETRALLASSGLCVPETNVPLQISESLTVIGDLVYPRWRTVIEYEGRHHQEDRSQYSSDIDRYALLRAENIAYLQVTQEKLDRPRTLVGEAYRLLLSRGYDGPQPEFGERWKQQFGPLSHVLGSRRDWLLARARGEVS